MRKVVFIISCLSLIILSSCHKKKLTEVVEVPLPAKEEKMTIGSPDEVKAEPGAFELVKLPYKYDGCAPNIDPMTMELHYSRIYLNYTNNLNKALAGAENESEPIEDLLKKLDMTDVELRNNMGGYYNHSLYWEIIGGKGGKPADTLASSIDKTFGSFDNFKKQFTASANKQIGSGWAWLVVNKKGELLITSSNNNDNPIMKHQLISGTPILALDVWEHAYYLNNQNKRGKYIDAFFNVLNWKKVGEKYEALIKK